MILLHIPCVLVGYDKYSHFLVFRSYIVVDIFTDNDIYNHEHIVIPSLRTSQQTPYTAQTDTIFPINKWIQP